MNLNLQLNDLAKVDYQNRCIYFKKSQRGIVLFIAMVALVVMSLASVALIRSVDTNSLITGNLSFKQTSMISSSYGIESLSDFLGNRASDFAYVSDPSNGYYALCTATQSSPANICDGALLLQDATWQAGATSRLADGLQIAAGIDAYGNTIEYIVERMCSSFDPVATPAGSATNATCLLARRAKGGGSQIGVSEPKAGGPLLVTDLPIYRVTVRVRGPKNTTSFVQAFIS